MKDKSELNKLYEERVNFLRSIYEKSTVQEKVGVLSRLENLTLQMGVQELPYKSVLSFIGKDYQEGPVILRGKKGYLRKDFSEFIKKLRLKRGLSVDEIVREIGIHRANYYRYEKRGVKRPHPSSLRLLAKYFNIPLSEFYE